MRSTDYLEMPPDDREALVRHVREALALRPTTHQLRSRVCNLVTRPLGEASGGPLADQARRLRRLLVSLTDEDLTDLVEQEARQ